MSSAPPVPEGSLASGDQRYPATWPWSRWYDVQRLAMQIEDLTPLQLSTLQKAKADVMREGFLNGACTDQQFLNAMTVHRRTRALVELLGSAMKSPRFAAMNRAFESFSEAAEQLWDRDGVWNTDGWRSS